MNIEQFPAHTEDGQPSRIETCVMQFGDDWPGVFIRGDQALHFAMQLRQIRMHLEVYDLYVWPESGVLDGLISILESCDVTPTTEEPCHGPNCGKSE